LAKTGPREFYEGETARLIAEEMTRNGGLIGLDDLRTYRAVERPALHCTYRGYDVATMPPPSSGGIVLFEMLAMLEPRNLAPLGHASAAKYHLFAEIMRRAYRDRAEYLGDPDFVKMPVEGLLDKTYAQNLMKNFDPDHATVSATLAPGIPAGLESRPAPPKAPGSPSAESMETTHFSIVDSAGNAVSNTYTLNSLFGNGVTVTGAGFLLNNEMDDFASAPGTPNSYGFVQSEKNAIAPHKRPLSSMSPTIVRKNGKVFLVTGSPGGATIINTVFLVLNGVIDEGMAITQAVEQPRFSNQWLPDRIVYEPNAFSEDTLTLLKAKGHTLTLTAIYGEDPLLAPYRRYWGDAESIMVDPASGKLLGATDPRSFDSAAIGYE
jgi:gamma-glutamyltranspeptidase/glutathione hydrolase